jgi:macrodomain Ter protein organizer (MatP/YcbG family)
MVHAEKEPTRKVSMNVTVDDVERLNFVRRKLGLHTYSETIRFLINKEAHSSRNG